MGHVLNNSNLKKKGKSPQPKSFRFKEKKLNSFFAGIGGFDLAFEKNGFSPTFFCENNDFCRSVLKRHWPEAKNSSDICKLSARDIPEADIWTAGFPCQDLSLARTPHGSRSGLQGTQSGLVFTFLDLLSTHKPPVVLLENVVGLLNSHKGSDFRCLLNSLTKLGYAVAWRVLNARYFGVPQSRPRIFISAWLNSPSEAIESLFEEEIADKPTNGRKGFILESKCQRSGTSVPQISFCISATSGRHTGLDWARSYVTYPSAVRRLTPLECERLQGLPDNWTLPDFDYSSPLKGIETNRYHSIGNAVCVPVVEWIAERIYKVTASKKMRHKNISELEIKNTLFQLSKRLSVDECEIGQLSLDQVESKWKSGGIAFGNYYATTAVSPSPVNPLVSRFIDVVDKSSVNERYFLSTNAIAGILRRVDKLGRNLFPPLDATLRKISNQRHTTSSEPLTS